MPLSTRIGGYKLTVAHLCAIAVILIIVYGMMIRGIKTCDHLEKKLIDHPTLSLDGWGTLHIMFFMLLGFLYPNNELLMLGVGIGWEIVETVLGQNKFMVGGKRLQLIGDQDDSGNPTGDEEAYWYGRSSDVLMNMVGYTVGSKVFAPLRN